MIVKGGDVRDAMFISSRVCGVCGGVHSVASWLAIEMAFGIAPPPMGLALRNVQLALDFRVDNPVHLYLLAAPDYSQVVVERTNPSLWERAKKTETRYAAVHGFRTMAELMEACNPLTGKLYLEGLHMTRGPKVVDAVERRAPPGTVFVLEPEVPDPHALTFDERRAAFSNFHLAEPARVLLLARAARRAAGARAHRRLPARRLRPDRRRSVATRFGGGRHRHPPGLPIPHRPSGSRRGLRGPPAGHGVARPNSSAL